MVLRVVRNAQGAFEAQVQDSEGILRVSDDSASWIEALEEGLEWSAVEGFDIETIVIDSVRR